MKTASIALAAVLSAANAAAGQLAGVTLPDQMRVGGRELTLNGLGLREATVLMVDVYVAGLYLEAKTSDPAVILKPDRTKALVMHFVRNVPKEELTGAWTKGFEKNAGDKRQAVASGLAALNAAMVDLKKGDVLSLAYQPGAGVAVTIKEREVAVIPGADFQSVLYAIWVGPHPPNATLREGLLGLTPVK
jgi:hypothetical protein